MESLLRYRRLCNLEIVAFVLWLGSESDFSLLLPGREEGGVRKEKRGGSGEERGRMRGRRERKEARDRWRGD